jgi:hypothetical protein
MQPSGVLRIAANQQTTHEWRTGHRHRFSVYVSRFVVGECAAGDLVASADRLRVLAEVPLLEVTTDAESLAGALLEEVPLPPKAATDALHIAVAAVNGVEYLLTWNCRHIANPALRPRIESVCRRLGFEPPVICTPQELLEIDDGNRSGRCRSASGSRAAGRPSRVPTPRHRQRSAAARCCWRQKSRPAPAAAPNRRGRRLEVARTSRWIRRRIKSKGSAESMVRR